MKIKNKLIAAVAAPIFAIGLGVAVASPSAASAPAVLPMGVTCSWLDWCGNMYNAGSVGVGVVRNWSSHPKWDRILYPGQGTRSTFGWADVDGLYVGSGYCAKLYDPTRRNTEYTGRGPKYYQIHDNDSFNVYAYKC